MEQLPHDWFALTVLVFVLGLKHGFDADHLATIDGLARYNARANPGLARFCGTLFSLGHGAVVVVVAAMASLMAHAWTVPDWMESFGVFTSIFFLSLLGSANLYAILRTPSGQVVTTVGFKGRWLGGLQRAGRPSLIALVGALFALSFDTMSQAALFALGANRSGDWRHATGLGVIFMLGMLVTDGINGLWISRLLRRADRAAQIASRIMGFTVAGLSLAVAALGAAKYFSPRVDAWMEGSGLLAGLAVVAIIGAAFAAAWMLAHPRAEKTA
jgi:high-affinity nickel-transport protein